MEIDCIVTKGDDGVYCAEVPAMPGLVTDGRTLTELRERLAEAVGLYLEDIADEQVEKARAATPADVWRRFSFDIVPGTLAPIRKRARKSVLT